MKVIVSLLALGFASLASAATPFVVSSDKLAAIVSEPRIWKRVTGAIRSVKLLDTDREASVYEVSTVETVPVRDAADRTIGYRDVKCTFVAAVESVTKPNGSVKLYVDGIDFSGCPSARARR